MHRTVLSSPARRPLRAAAVPVALTAALALAPASAPLASAAPAAAPAAARTAASAAARTAASSAASSAAPAKHWIGPHYTPGSAGIGDPTYPTYGNGGYNVRHYDIRVRYTPRTDRLTGTTTITAVAKQDLSRFDLDLALPVSRVEVDGRKVRSSQKGSELTVTPARGIRKNARMKVVVTYAGNPSKVRVAGKKPWVRTSDGAVAVGEPQIAAWWFPSNDHPRDKAGYDITITVPHGVEALSNGVKVSQKRAKDGRDVWHWRERAPMASYLAFMAVGQFDVAYGRTAAGLPVVTAVASNGGAAGRNAKRDFKRTAEVVSWLSKQWGPYPFDALGGVAPHANFGFALENQTRPVYTREFWEGGTNLSVIVHEQAHQWFGDSVSVNRWRDVWLNEGFATFSEWLWAEQHRQGSAQQMLDFELEIYAKSDPFWRLQIGRPVKGKEFDDAVYERGAMTLQALRRRIGDRHFFDLMRRWAAAHRGGNAQVGQFTALAEKVSGQQLDGFFRAWLYTGARPALTAANGLRAPSAPAARRLAAPSGVEAVPDETVRATLARMRRTHAVLRSGS